MSLGDCLGTVHLLDKRGRRIQLCRLEDKVPDVFREMDSGLLKAICRDLVIRFAATAHPLRRRKILRQFGLKVLRVNPFVSAQVVALPPDRFCSGEDLVEISNCLMEMSEVLFATPSFVSQYRRQVPPSVLPEEWHLRDLNVPEAWEVTTGKPEITVAVLDDGVDVDHPNLKPGLWKNPDSSAKDQIGRDFVLPDDHPDHFNPRPKRFQFPFDDFDRNDIHGTPCAGLIAARGLQDGAVGVAPGCRFLPIKIFHADALVPDERVADAIRYAALHADILSCSWTGGTSLDVQHALEDAGNLGRDGWGSAVFCAAGNDFGRPVAFPARDPNAVAVGASIDQGRMAEYSNTGSELAFLAPSGGGAHNLFTTTVRDRGSVDGLHTDAFSGTSAAAALAAGVGALVLSVRPGLNRHELKDLLAATADTLTGSPDAPGRLNAGRAVTEAASLARRR